MDQQRKAEAANRLLNDPLFEDLMDNMMSAIITSWLGSGANEEKQRENLYHLANAMQMFRANLQGIVSNERYDQANEDVH